MLEVYTRLESAKNRVKELSSQYYKYQSQIIPEMMARYDMSHIELRDGTSIDTITMVEGNLPTKTAIGKARMEKRDELLNRLNDGLDWLRNNGHGSLIKNFVTVKLGKGQDEQAGELKQFLLSHGYEYDADQTVHPQTLKAFIREQIAAGNDIPIDTFDVKVVNIAKLKEPNGGKETRD